MNLKALLFYLTIISLCNCACSSGRKGCLSEEVAQSPVIPPKGSTTTENLPEPVSAEESVGPDTGRPLFQEIPLKSFALFRVHQGPINDLKVTRDGKRAFSAGQDGKVILSDIVGDQGDSSLVLRSEVIFSSYRPVFAVELSPDESKIAIAQYSNVIILETESRRVVGQMTRVEGRIRSLAWDPRGEFIAVGRGDGEVFLWKLGEGGRIESGDNLLSMEYYPVGYSPVVSILFHPSGRSIFVAEEEGMLSIVRVRRTEREMGILDGDTYFDKEALRRGYVEIMKLGTLPAPVEDLWLDESGQSLYASAGSGTVYRYKTRGLVLEEIFQADSDVVFDIQSVKLRLGNQQVEVLVTSGRNQRLRFWCMRETPPSGELPGTELVVSAPLEQGAQVAQSESRAQSAEVPKDFRRVIAESAVLKGPASILDSGRSSPLLWGAQKTGNLLVFDGRTLERFAPVFYGVNRCAHAFLGKQ